jgi:hypothetical protein
MQTQLSKMPFGPWRGVWKLLAALALCGMLIPTAALTADKPTGELRIALAFLVHNHATFLGMTRCASPAEP